MLIYVALPAFPCTHSLTRLGNIIFLFARFEIAEFKTQPHVLLLCFFFCLDVYMAPARKTLWYDCVYLVVHRSHFVSRWSTFGRVHMCCAGAVAAGHSLCRRAPARATAVGLGLRAAAPARTTTAGRGPRALARAAAADHGLRGRSAAPEQSRVRAPPTADPCSRLNKSLYQRAGSIIGISPGSSTRRMRALAATPVSRTRSTPRWASSSDSNGLQKMYIWLGPSVQSRA